MKFNLEELVQHDGSDACPICRTQDIVDRILVPAAAVWEQQNDLPMFSMALHGATSASAGADDLPADDIALAERFKAGYEKVTTEIHKVIIGQSEVIEQVLLTRIVGCFRAPWRPCATRWTPTTRSAWSGRASSTRTGANSAGRAVMFPIRGRFSASFCSFIA